jgi:DNA-binding LacI/PurR family transcriptional regulator
MRRLGLADRTRVVAGGSTEEAGSSAAGELRPELPTAVVAFNDRCALGLLDHLRRHGVAVPGDVSVVGYDDSPLARLGTVDLTSVSQSPAAMGQAAVALAVERLEGQRTESVERVLQPQLVVRSTTAPPKGP